MKTGLLKKLRTEAYRMYGIKDNDKVKIIIVKEE